MIQLKNLSVDFQTEKKILNNVNLAVQDGEFICILGASGSGKSTLLRAIAGLISYQGTVAIEGESSMVFQNSNLLPWLTVMENILLPLRLQKNFSNERPRVLSLLKQLDLQADIAGYFPHQLSGGMKMRVATARALITNPKFILMDEAFSSIDEWTRESLQELVYRIWREHRTTILFVTHSLIESLSLGQRIFIVRDANLLEYKPASNPSFFQKSPKERYGDSQFQNELQNLKKFVFTTGKNSGEE